MKHKHLKMYVLILCYQQQEENSAPYSPLSVRDVPQRTAKPEMARTALRKLNWLQKLNRLRPEKLNNVGERKVHKLTQEPLPQDA